MQQKTARAGKNLILTRLSDPDFKLLQPHLEDVDLPLRKMLERPLRKIEYIYFPETGIASVVADRGKPIEVGLIGMDGMTGLAILLGDDRPENQTFMQVAGKGRRLKASTLRAALDQSPTMHRSMLRYVHTFLNQTARTALANGRSTIDERLARWLLMADDRIEGGELLLTHEFLAMMLAVRRSGVTLAIQALERGGVISRRRGAIVILDRCALEKLASDTYARPELPKG